MIRFVDQRQAERLAAFFATLGPIGYLPASGTIASAITLWFWYVYMVEDPEQLVHFAYWRQCALWILCTVQVLMLIEFGRKYFTRQDPSQIVLDEVVGMIVALYMLPTNILSYGIAFCLFRLFDIFKPLGIARAEKLPGAFGILVDDMLAGILANVCTRIVLVCLNR